VGPEPFALGFGEGLDRVLHGAPIVAARQAAPPAPIRAR
jgi:hypothetical protein